MMKPRKTTETLIQTCSWWNTQNISALIRSVTSIAVERFYSFSVMPQISHKGLMWPVARSRDFNTFSAVIRYIEK